MKYEISISIKNVEEMEAIQENADTKLRDLRQEPRKNKRRIRNVNDALFLLFPSPISGSGVFYTHANLSTLTIGGDDDDDDDTRQALRDIVDAVISIAPDFVMVKAV
jgi:hypothetical protein